MLIWIANKGKGSLGRVARADSCIVRLRCVKAEKLELTPHVDTSD